VALAGDNIICFAKDRGEHPTSNHHVMIELAKRNRVLWLNSVATRTPDFTSGRDLRKIARKVASLGRGPVKVRENLWVWTPLVLPFPRSRIARLLNRQILTGALRALRWRLGFDEFQLWLFLPNAVDYVGSLGESVVVYYCVDEWSMFSYIEESFMADADRRLCRRADVVFATCHGLAERKRELNPETHVATHGVDHELFAAALDQDAVIPTDLAKIESPRIGFYGTVQDWVDLELIAELARRRRDWQFVLIGQVLCDVSPLEGLENVHLFGRREHASLPAYCRGFDVALIPYVMSERMSTVNPIKLREYLSAGLPVVSSPLPEVARYPECAIASGADEFETAIAAAIDSDSASERRRRSETMSSETWAAKVAAVRQTVERVMTERTEGARV